MEMMKKIHFLGIGGSGASAVANIADAYGFEVSGCDKSLEGEFALEIEKFNPKLGHSKDHLEDIDILTVTPAILSLDPGNEEISEAKRRGIEVLTWQEFMGKYLEVGKFVIAVCGTHGKSTTTAMVSVLLEDCGLDPTAELGAKVARWGRNYKIGKSKYFVTEADEFNNNFLSTTPDITVLTTVEMDHPEFFKNFDDYQESFLRFLYKSRSLILANFSDPGVLETMEKFQKNKDKPNNPKIIDYSKTVLHFPLRVLGEFNRMNASAAFQVGLFLNLDSSAIQNSLMRFEGISRRIEELGEFNGARIISDFAHHPTEIKLTLEAIRKQNINSRIVLVYEPHMFSRTKALFHNFVEVFRSVDADQVFILDIYPSREVDTGLINSKQLADAVGKRTVSYLGPKEEVEDFLKLVSRRGDLVIFMGAGEIDKLARKIAENI